MKMSSDIKVGDLVMVIRATSCCGNSGAVGTVGIVEKIYHGCLAQCFYCKSLLRAKSDAMINGYGYDTYRLKKIDPPALDESVERVQELETA
jgi:hypothetical protein